MVPESRDLLTNRRRLWPLMLLTLLTLKMLNPTLWDTRAVTRQVLLGWKA